MDIGLVGIYWFKRALTLRGYGDFLRNVLQILRTVHPAFCDLYWVGDGKHRAVSIDGDFKNLDELVYKHSWSKKKDIFGERNSDGTPTWAAENRIGFSMMFNTGKSSKEGGVTLSVHAGDGGSFTPNAVTISFPVPNSPEFVHREFYSYEFLLNLLEEMIRFATPERGIATSHDFSSSVYGDGPYDIGWLSYFEDGRCAPLAKDFLAEKIDLRGTLFSLGKDSMFVNSEETVSLGRELREALKKVDVVR